MKTKIVHIVAHSPGPKAYCAKKEDKFPTLGSTNPDDAKYYERIEYYPYWIGFFQNDWHVLVSKEYVNRYDKYEVECWRPYQYLKEVHSKKINGITHRLFPSSKTMILGKKILGEKSSEMIDFLDKQSKKYNIILHLHHYGLLTDMVASKFGHLPIYSAQVGGPCSVTRYMHSETLSNKIYNLIYSIYQSSSIYNSDIFTTESNRELDIISKINNNSERLPCDGIDTKWYFNDKVSSRNHLNISQDKKVILHVGPFTRIKGIEHIISSYKNLKKQYDLELFLIGGNKSQDLYNFCKSSGAQVIERINRDELRYYYSAADVFVKYAINDYWLYGMGIGTASTESLASNTPVVGNHLENFLGDTKKVGLQSSNPIEFTKDIEKILSQEIRFENLRDYVKKNYDWDNLVPSMHNRYNLFSKKYNYN